MNIRSIRYIKSCIGTDPILYDGKFQVACIGRSNVGKSSFINALAGKEIARSSKHPGRTKRLDFFLVNESFYLVDLPGYGYAKLSEEHKEQIRKMILWYIMYSEVPHRMIVLLIDASVGLMPFDEETIKMLKEHHIPFLLVANKIDKIPHGQRDAHCDQIATRAKQPLVFPHSMHKRIGKQEILDEIEAQMVRRT